MKLVHVGATRNTKSVAVVRDRPTMAGREQSCARIDFLYRKYETMIVRDFREALGANEPSGTLQVTVFIPSVDRGGYAIDSEFWREECLRVLATLFRGATAFPPGRGAWRDDERGGQLVFDDTVLVTSYADPGTVTEPALLRLREFLHRLGRDANQGEVGVVVAGHYYGIKQYDSENGGKRG